MQATGLRRNFGKFTAVDGVDIALRSGKVTGLIGPNGAGKTTLMLILAGMLAPDAGEISIAGENFATHPRASRARIGWLPDSFGSWGSLTVKEIMMDFGRLYGLSRSSADSRTHELLHLVHLEHMLHSYAHTLSRGQKQRLGVARALIHQPRVLILDEPAAGMDPRSRIELRDILRAQAEAGVAVLISSHVLSELENLIDEAVVMEAGKVAETFHTNPGVAQKIVRYRICVADSDGECLRDVTADAGVQLSARGEKGEYELSFSGEIQPAELLSQVTAAGAAVTLFAPLKESLEDMYVKLEQRSNHGSRQL